MKTPSYDVVVVGGGAAGLSAALVLGRARRRVAVIDAGKPRNAPAAHMQGYLSRDGMAPAELLAVGRAEIAEYGVEVIDASVADVAATGGPGFTVRLDDGVALVARRLLVATGVRDRIPDLPGVHERWGRDLLHCPYCHGWEVRDQPLGVLGSNPGSVLHAQLVRQWSDDVIYFAHTQEPSAEEAAELEARGIGVVHGEVARLVVEDDRLTGLELVDGRVVHRAAVFVRPTNVPHPDDLLRSLGCALDDAGFAIVDRTGRTSVDGLWGCGQRRRPPRPGHHVRRGRLGRRDRHQRRSRSGRHRPGRLGRRLNMTVPARLADTATATDSTSPIGNAGCVTGSQPVRTGRSCRQGTCTSPRRCSPRRTGTMPAAGPGRSDSRTGIRTRCRPHTHRRSIE